MEIFIGNLPRYAAVSHLNRFFLGFGQVAHFRILEKVREDGEVERFGHGVIEPDVAAQRAVEHLNGKRLLGEPVVVREYVHRAPSDRRSGSRVKRSNGEARPREDRRLRGRFRPAPLSWR
jgi:RNA recognition motif-containing protein